MNLHSRELVEEVIGKAFVNYSKFDNYVYYSYIDRKQNELVEAKINIYELMHLMKEWAWSKGYVLSTYVDSKKYYACDMRSNNSPQEYTPRLVEETEFEAVVRAAEWILKESK